MEDTREAKREGGARTRAMPMKRRKERANNLRGLDRASLPGETR